MQKTLTALAILLWALLVSSLAFATSKKSPTQTHLEELHNQGKERVVVVFKDKVHESVLAGYNTKLIRKLKTLNALICEIDQNDIELLKQQPNVKDVIPDTLIKVPRLEKRPPGLTGQQEKKVSEIMPLSYDGSVTVRWNNLQAGLNSQAAWDNYDLDGTGIKIAFVDTGVNYTMENLDDNYTDGNDFLNDDNDPINDTLDEAHGTGIISVGVGEGVNEVVGTAYNASYYAVKVLDHYGGYASDVIDGISWASTEPHKADIISMSLVLNLGGLQSLCEQTCNNAYAQGIVLVAASGNSEDIDPCHPAAFANVISVGAHAEDQSLYYKSNGGVDVLAPGVSVYTVGPDNVPILPSGTSLAVPHVSALIALQLQYARANNIELNNGYLWEVMKHSAVDLGIDPNYQGQGKVYAAQTDQNDPNIGSIDLIASNWPIDYDFGFLDYAFIDANNHVYQIGEDMNQIIDLTNITDTLGNYSEDINDVNVTATQVYYGQPNEPNLPGNSIKVFPTVTLLKPGDANSITLSYSYTIPPQTTPGLKKTKLKLEFNFVGNDRVIEVFYNEPNSFWYAAIPGDLDLDNDVNLADFCMFAQQWQHTDCNQPDWCSRADTDQNGSVNWSDLYILAENWLSGL